MNPLTKAYWIAKGVGWDNVPRRIYQGLKKRSGLLTRQLSTDKFLPHKSPLFNISNTERLDQWSRRKNQFLKLPSSSELQSVADRDTWNVHVIRPLNDALSGNYPMFSRWTSPLGWPPNFNLDATNAVKWPSDAHWTQTTRSGPPYNDLKLVWEPNRLSLVYLLARAYQYDSDERWAEAFWELIEAWIRDNPTSMTVAWGCGQEVAFRMMAILFGCFVFSKSPLSTAEQLSKIDCLMWQFGLRIAANINYAISQENNHALSEAAGLWTIGILYPEFPESRAWKSTGKAILEKEVRRQIYEDGSYVQHSMSYHRVMLDDLLWVIALGRKNNEIFSETFLTKVSQSIAWLDKFVQKENGQVPNLGSNDGANVLPLSCSDYLDYRPVLVAGSSLLQVPISTYGNGAWDEKTLWLTGNSAHEQSHPPHVHQATTVKRVQYWNAPIGGYHVFDLEQSKLITKACSYIDRPCQNDMLHIDLWHRGFNLLCDSGSYHYYHKDTKLKNYFYSTEAHNTVKVNNAEQMTKGPNFLWFHWPKSHWQQLTETKWEFKSYFTGAVPYAHTRQIEFLEQAISVIDLLECDGNAKSAPNYYLNFHLTNELTWVLNDNSQLEATNQGVKVASLNFESPGHTILGTAPVSLYYGEKTDFPVLTFQTDQNLTKTIINLF